MSSGTATPRPSKPQLDRPFTHIPGSDVYVSHPPKTATADAQGKAPSVILIFGWMGAQLAHLHKYTDQYNKLYPLATQILVRTHQSYFCKGEAAQRASIVPVIKLLRDAGIHESTPAESSGLLVHTFSNGGALAETSLARTIAQSHSTNQPALPAQALVYDSLPGVLNLRVTATAFTAPIRSPLVRTFAKFVVGTVYILGMAWGYTVGIVLGNKNKEDTFTRLHRELDEPRLLPLGVPRTYLYSDVDELVPMESVEGQA